MKKTEVMFFFDTEDFTSETCADATLQLARLLEDEGVIGHFAIVGLFAEQLTNWGRSDVIQALHSHIIGHHTYGHSLHPTIVEMSEGEDYTAAYRRVMEKESLALDMIKKHLETDEVLFAVPPGDSESYVAKYCYDKLGIPFYCGTVVHDARNSLVEYCGMKHINYTESLEEMYIYESQENEDILDFLATHNRVIVYTHPNITVKREFWDQLNYKHANLREYGDWVEAEDRTPEEIAELRDKFRGLIRALKNDDRFEITDLRKLKSHLDKRPVKTITRSAFSEIKASLEAHLAPPRDGSYSVSEVFMSCVELLRGGTLSPDTPTHGFLYAPQGITTKITLTRDEIVTAARGIDRDSFIPASIKVGEVDVGPADLLFAMLEVLTKDTNEITLEPRIQEVDMTDFPELRDFHMSSETWVHAYDFGDEYVSDRLRLQSWTLRYCES